ncbi:MAG: hypothetical protein KJ065_20570 [Anaerolineae bacterium]|nr:hypothetical protein [Anaerolineae bacterium]
MGTNLVRVIWLADRQPVNDWLKIIKHTQDASLPILILGSRLESAPGDLSPESAFSALDCG